VVPRAAPVRIDFPLDAAPMRQSSELKNLGLKATFPRMKILELFDKTEGKHLTADDVYRLLLGDGMDIGLATVYRALIQFEQAGLIERHHFKSGKAVFEKKAMQHHDHLVCTRCGHVEEFHDEEIERRQKRIAKERGFTIQTRVMVLYVECDRPECPNRDKRAPEAGMTNPAPPRRNGEFKPVRDFPA
jgi:Fur family ferric uptake transcriptional regulator